MNRAPRSHVITWLSVLSVLFYSGCAAPSGVKLDRSVVESIPCVLHSVPDERSVGVTLFFMGGYSAGGAREQAIEEVAINSLLDSSEQFIQENNRLGIHMFAAVSSDYSAITMTCPVESWESAWIRLMQTILQPRFDQNTISKRSQNMVRSLRHGDSIVFNRFYRTAHAMYFKHHPYDYVAGIDNFIAVDSSAVRSYYSQLLVRSRISIAVVGPVSLDELKMKLGASGLIRLPEGDYRAPKVSMASETTPQQTYILPVLDSLQKDQVVGYLRLPDVGSKGWYEALRMAIWFRASLYDDLSNEHLTQRVTADYKAFRAPYFRIWFTTTNATDALIIARSCSAELATQRFTSRSGQLGMHAYLTEQQKAMEDIGLQSSTLGAYALIADRPQYALIPVTTFDELDVAQLHKAADNLANFTWFVQPGKH